MYPNATYSHLPDPVHQRAFYESVALKRGMAWVIDTMIVAVLVFIALLFTAFLGVFIFFAIWLVVSFGYRVATLTTEAVTLSSGSDRRVTGVYASLQAGLPLAAYAARLRARPGYKRAVTSEKSAQVA